MLVIANLIKQVMGVFMIASVYVNAHGFSMLYNYCEENDDMRAPFLTFQDIEFLLVQMQESCKKRYGNMNYVRFIPGIFDVMERKYKLADGKPFLWKMDTRISENTNDPSKRFATRRVSKLEFAEWGINDNVWNGEIEDLGRQKEKAMTPYEKREIAALLDMDVVYRFGAATTQIRNKAVYKRNVNCGLYFYGQNVEMSADPISQEKREELKKGLARFLKDSMVDYRLLENSERYNKVDPLPRKNLDVYKCIQFYGLQGYSFDDLVIDMKYAICEFNKRGMSKLNRELWERNNGDFKIQTGRKHYLLNFVTDYEEKIKKTQDEKLKNKYKELIDKAKNSYSSAVQIVR